MMLPQLTCPSDAMYSGLETRPLYQLSLWALLKPTQKAIEFPDADRSIHFEASVRMYRKIKKHKLLEVRYGNVIRFYHVRSAHYDRKHKYLSLFCPYYTNGNYQDALSDMQKYKEAERKYFRYLYTLEQKEKTDPS